MRMQYLLGGYQDNHHLVPSGCGTRLLQRPYSQDLNVWQGREVAVGNEGRDMHDPRSGIASPGRGIAHMEPQTRKSPPTKNEYPSNVKT